MPSLHIVFFFFYFHTHTHISSADRGAVETYRRLRNEPTHHYTCPAGDDDDDDERYILSLYRYVRLIISIAKEKK